MFRVGLAWWKELFAGAAVPEDLALVLEDVAAAVFVASHGEGKFLVTPAPKLEAGADGELLELDVHKEKKLKAEMGRDA